MPAYVDTSALVKRYVAEIGSAWVRRLLEAIRKQSLKKE
jgi:predicted nucleic acid-binding protein